MFSKYLRTARKKMELNMYEMSSELNITRMQLYRYENEKSMPTIDKLLSISNKINSNLNDMLEIHYEKKIDGENFGEKIKNLRKEKKLNQEDLAKLLKIHYTAIGKYEKNKTYPTTEKLIEICHYFEVSPSELLSNEIENLEID